MAKPQRPGRPQLTIWVPLDLRLALEAECKREGRTLTSEVVRRLERSLAQDEQRDEERLARAS